MSIKEIIDGANIEKKLVDILDNIHRNGPIELQNFEKLSYIKHFHPEIFSMYEKKLIYLIGLFYKTSEPESLLEAAYSIYADLLKSPNGDFYTPIQSSVYNQILSNDYFSFSAPTSAGKSHLFRDIIQNFNGDIVIIVPSRALISEYIYKILKVVDKSVLVLDFIDNINIENTKRRIYVITPERGKDLFNKELISKLNIELFLYDEAQLSEETIRGMKFDALVRRIDRSFPDAKKVFTHPFINNPEAQINKHDFDVYYTCNARNYNQHSVGKVYISANNDKFSYFSPFDNPPAKDKIELNYDLVEKIIRENGTLLVFTAKTRIINKQYLTDFSKYINLCEKITKPEAVNIINELRELIGATEGESDKHSQMIEMMERGIVIHHGSIPLSGRLLIEKFINKNFAKICFATSTLTQGINMPFDVVWINYFRFEKPLDLKNLIGRAGRSTNAKDYFDYGYVIIPDANIASFSNRIVQSSLLEEISLLDNNQRTADDDLKDIIEAIKEDSFDNELRITVSQRERLIKSNVNKEIKFILDNFIKEDKPVTGQDYINLKKSVKDKIKKAFKNVYIKHLRRDFLNRGEQSILSASIPILLWRIQGKAFSQVVSLRHAYISKKKDRELLKALYKRNSLSKEDYFKSLYRKRVEFSQKADTLPNIKLIQPFSLFDQGLSVNYVDYDTLVYDTYDYLDKVISLSLADPLCAAFQLYYNETRDERASIIKNCIQYGTNDPLEIWLIRYGFGFEDIEWIKNYIDSVDENSIKFNSSISALSETKYKLIERYI